MPIVVDILLRVLPTAKWACVRQFPRQLSMLWTALAFLTCLAAICSLVGSSSTSLPSSMVTCLRSFDVSRSCSPAFCSGDLKEIFPLMWRRTQNRSAGLSFLYPCFYSDVAPHALLGTVSCVRAFPQELRCCFPANVPRNWILWDASSLGTVKAGIPLRGTLPLLHHHL